MKITIEADDKDPESIKRARKMLAELNAEAAARERPEHTGRGAEARLHTLMRSPVTDLDLSARSRNALAAQDVATIGQLCALNAATLRRFPGIGVTCLAEIRDALEAIDLRLASEN